jgi:hypothetical protein
VIGSSTTQPSDISDQAVQLVKTATAGGIRLRLLGGLGIKLHSHGGVPAALTRDYGDMDVVVGSSDGPKLSKLLPDHGYEANRRFNALHGERRMIFTHVDTDRKVDVFVGVFNMCHKLDLDSHLPAEGFTLALSDLLLTKLQVVELTAKDLTDACALLLEHDLAPADDAHETIGLKRIAQVCSSDWGWFTTVNDNLQRVIKGAAEILSPNAASFIAHRAGALQEAMEAAPKSLGWRVRNRVGRRIAWYQLPEEVG